MCMGTRQLCTLTKKSRGRVEHQHERGVYKQVDGAGGQPYSTAQHSTTNHGGKNEYFDERIRVSLITGYEDQLSTSPDPVTLGTPAAWSFIRTLTVARQACCAVPQAAWEAQIEGEGRPCHWTGPARPNETASSPRLKCPASAAKSQRIITLRRGPRTRRSPKTPPS